MDGNIKKTIIDFVNEIGNSPNFQTICGESAIGSSNIRALSSIALNADCYEELKLFIEYKIAKGNGWERNFQDNKKFGEVILDYMNKIYYMCERDDEQTMKSISKFFGYLYWKARSIR